MKLKIITTVRTTIYCELQNISTLLTKEERELNLKNQIIKTLNPLDVLLIECCFTSDVNLYITLCSSDQHKLYKAIKELKKNVLKDSLIFS